MTNSNPFIVITIVVCILLGAWWGWQGILDLLILASPFVVLVLILTCLPKAKYHKPKN